MQGQDHSGNEMLKPVVVFVGRSNVGKSSVVRALTGRRIRVGKRPGTTRREELIDLGSVTLADMPGFGYIAGMDRASIDRMKTKIVQKLESWGNRIVVAVLVIDVSLFRELVERWESRNEIPVDIEFYGFLSEISRCVVVAANKIDKVANRKRLHEIGFVRTKLIRIKENPDVLPVSTKEKGGIRVLQTRIEQILQQEGLQRPDW